MKQNLIAKTAGLATLALMILWAAIAVADNMPGDIAPGENRFQVISFEPSSLCDESSVDLVYLSNGYIQKLLAEKTGYMEETRPLIQDLKSKWAALADELAKQSPEETRTTRLQNEISALDRRFMEKRLEHIMAMKEIKTNVENCEL